jgi:hypothetical protein
MLVDYLRSDYIDEMANWCWDFWTGDRVEFVFQSRYTGCNNNMGVKVSWRDIKKLCSCLASLGDFIGCLCQFIKAALGEEHMHRLGNSNAGNSNAFIRNPVATKKMWDGVQAAHLKTLSLCVVMSFSSKKPNIPILYRDMMEEIMECRTQATPLHPKIATWHDNSIRTGHELPFGSDQVKSVLMPRQALLKKLD